MNQPENDLKNIKEKLLQQIKEQYDPEKAEEFTKKINGMNDDEFVEFLKSQGLIKDDNSQCVFCALASGKMPRTEIAENQKAIAILELNPISKGHTLILPKDHIQSKEDLPQESKNLAEQVKIDIQKAFNPQRIDLIYGEAMGHQIINVLPIYNSENINSEREQKNPEELKKTKEEIENSKTETIEEAKPEQIEKKEEKKEVLEKSLWLRPRIP